MVLKIYYYSVRKVFLNKIKLLSLVKFKKILYYVYNILYKYLNNIILKNQYLHLFIDKKNIINCVTFLKYNVFILSNQLLDFFVVDNLELIINQKNRIEFIYVFLSTVYNIRIFLHGFLSIFDFLPSVHSLFNSSNWLEREVWDLYGIFFFNHNDLRRILTDYGFMGFPFRKDFPLTGYIELAYDDINKLIKIEPLELTQEFRFFKLESSWINSDIKV